MQAATRVTLELTGRPPGLVLNNGELADDTNPIAVQIAELVDAGRGRKKLTDEQRERKDHLNWRGSLYVNQDGKLYLPANNLLRAIVAAAREYNLGTKIEDRGAIMLEAAPPELIIDHDGPDDLKKLWADTRYRFRTLVNPNPSSRNKGLLPLMRPVFPGWSITTTAVIIPEMINWESFVKVMEAAGNVGVGNARKIGYGRFNVKITKLDIAKQSRA